MGVGEERRPTRRWYDDETVDAYAGWGNNSYGQIAYAAGSNHTSPAQVISGSPPSTVRQLFEDPDCQLEGAARMIQAEPVLSARVVAVANSVAFNRSGRTISNVRAAVTLAEILNPSSYLQNLGCAKDLFRKIGGKGGCRRLFLAIGVSYLVVPRFRLTPSYPVWLTRLLPAGLFLVLCLWSLQLVAPSAAAQAWQSGVALAGVLLAGSYALTTLWLQSRRRRRQVDPTLFFWRGAMVSLLAFALSWIVFEALPQLGGNQSAPLWLGVLAIPGLFLCVITGMLYKIMPFLNWLHLQQQGGTAMTSPNMKQMIPERAMRGQMRLHFAALGLLLAAVLWPALALAAGLAFTASCLWLEWNLIGAARVYARFRDRIRAAGRATVVAQS